MSNQSQKGFSVIELLVTMFIFSIIVGISAGFLISAIGAQKRSSASQQLFDQMFHSLEYMSRALRAAEKSTGSCISEGYNYEVLLGDTPGIKFIHRGECWSFVLLNEQSGGGQIVKIVGEESPVPLTSGATMNITDFSVIARGHENEDQGEKQPRVTLSIQGESATSRAEAFQSIHMQTSISQRAYNTR
ncbi:MAG: prepilin-type N-terminal cleavage/methylation domain-containing protein [bacterium]|nr:prepilin-type N-terminal cleavage/methylation domain-containing protein [bacterium]